MSLSFPPGQKSYVRVYQPLVAQLMESTDIIPSKSRTTLHCTRCHQFIKDEYSHTCPPRCPKCEKWIKAKNLAFHQGSCRPRENAWRACIYCSKFVSYNELDTGEAVSEFRQDYACSEYGSGPIEETTCWHRKCKDDYTKRTG